MQSIELNVYQLGKDGRKSFNYVMKGESEQVNTDKIASLFAAKLFKIHKAQTNIVKKGGKSRMFRLAKSKNIYFSIEADDEFVIDTETAQVSQQLTFGNIKLSDLAKQSAMTCAIKELFTLLSDNDIEL